MKLLDPLFRSAIRLEDLLSTNANLTPTSFRTLRFLKDRKDADRANVSPKEFVEELGISAATGSGVISRLRGAGYITDCPDSNDKRRKIIHITPKGEEVLAHALHVAQIVEDKLIDKLTPTVYRELVESLHEVYSTLR